MTDTTNDIHSFADYFDDLFHRGIVDRRTALQHFLDTTKDTTMNTVNPRLARPAATMARIAETNRVDQLRRELELAETRLAERLEAEAAHEQAMDRFGPDRFVDGCVILFSKRFPHSVVEYNYAAIRTNGRWYTTGPKSPKNYSWDELVAWMIGSDPTDPGVDDVFVVTALGSLVDGRAITPIGVRR